MHKFLEFLFSLNDVRLTDWGKVHFRMETEHLWWAVPVLVGLGVFGYWSYRVQSASPAKKFAMGVLRAGVLVLVMGLFLRPAIVLDDAVPTRSVVAVWVDDTASMDLRDPYKDAGMRELVKVVSGKVKLPGDATRANRYDLAMDALLNAKGNWLHRVAEKQDVAVFTGGAHAMLIGVGHDGGQVDMLVEQIKGKRPVEEATDVPTVVQEMFRQLQGQPVSAMVLLTDGRSTEGTVPTGATTEAQRHGTPLFALAVGSAEEPLNVQLASMTVPENVFVKDPVSAKIKVRVTGIALPTPVRITMYRKVNGREEAMKDAGGKAVTREVTAEPGEKDMTVELIFKPDKTVAEKSERFDLVARAEAIGDELTLADNAVTASTTVMDAKVNVLFVDGYPRWEYRYLKNELVREKSVSVSCLLISADENFAQEGTIPITRFPETKEEMDKYDVLLIGDVEPQYFSPNQMKLIVDFVKTGGGGVGWIAGWQYNPDSYKGTALEPLLPIVPDDPNVPTMGRAENAPFNPVPTAAGRESNLFRFFDKPEDNVKQMAENPEMYWYKPVVGVKGASEVLAVHPTKMAGGAAVPLIVTGQYGAGRTLFSAVADTWRWRRYKGEPLYQSYWLQMCRLLYSEKAFGQSKRIQVLAESPTVEVGKPLRLTGLIKDATLVGTVGDKIVVDVSDESGALAPVTLARVGSALEKYEGVMTTTKVGKLRLEVKPGTLPVEVLPLEVNVEGPQREMADVTVDLAGLKVLADRTEGKVVELPKAGELATLIADKSLMTWRSRSEELWNKPIALFLVVVLLTVEWLIRKSAGLI